MNPIYEPYANLAEFHESISYGKHSSGRVYCGPSAPGYTARHRADDNAKVGA